VAGAKAEAVRGDQASMGEQLGGNKAGKGKRLGGNQASKGGQLGGRIRLKPAVGHLPRVLDWRGCRPG
jgi:hypothetical protein